MESYDYAKKVTTTVRTILKHDDRVKAFIGNHPSCDLNAKFQLESLIWTYYDITLIVTSKRIVLQQRNTESTIRTYRSFDKLLEMT